MIEKTIEGIKYRFNEETLTAEVIQKNGYVGDIIIPETIVFNQVSYGVTGIGNEAFSECESLTSIVIPNSVTSIGFAAFYKCFSLTTVVIPDSVTSIGKYAFRDCSSLTSIVIHDGVTRIGRSAFDGCSSLTSIVIPDSVTSIGHEAFRGCDSLKQKPTHEIELKNIVYRLLMHNHHAMVIGYSGCPKTINIPSEINHEEVIYRVTSIEEGAFRDCSSLTSIVIPDGVTSIGKRTFCGCKSLTSIVIPDGVTSIGEEAFAYCKSLTSITFNGTKAQWKGIKLGNSLHAFSPTEVIHCTDGEVKI